MFLLILEEVTHMRKPQRIKIKNNKKSIDTYIPRDMMYTVKRGMLWMLN